MWVDRVRSFTVHPVQSWESASDGRQAGPWVGNAFSSPYAGTNRFKFTGLVLPSQRMRPVAARTPEPGGVYTRRSGSRGDPGGKASPLAAMFNFPVMNPPTPGRHATYGEWPNSRGRTSVPAAGSLVGDHVVRGNYSPEIRFALAGQNDFLAPLLPKSSALPSGAMRVAWPAVPNALAYAAGVVGTSGDGTVIMWSSSEVKTAGAVVHDYVAQGDIPRLVQQKALMAATASECIVPAEVVKATQGAMLQMAAYGPEANFAAPRTDPHRWTVKLRSKSTHMAMLGVEMPDMGGGDDDGPTEGRANSPTPAEQKAGRKRGLLKGLGRSVLGGIR